MAIVAVLIAVSVPVFTSRLEKSRESTDMANMRAAKASAVVAMLDESHNSGEILWYDADRGVFLQQNTRPQVAYGKGTSVEGDSSNIQDGYDPTRDYTDAMIRAQFNRDNVVLWWTRDKSAMRGTPIGREIMVGGS